MNARTKSSLKMLSQDSQIDLMIKAMRQLNMPLLKKLVQIFIEEDRIHELNILDDHQQQIFLNALEQLLISAIHHHKQKAFVEIIQRMQTIKNHAHPIDLFYDIIPLKQFADALADDNHQEFLNLIIEKHFLNDDYLLFLAFKTENLKLLCQLIQQGIHIHHQALELLLEQSMLISSEARKQFIQYLLVKSQERQHQPSQKNVKTL